MTVFGPLGFAAPLALIGLLALPIIWRLLRAAPPSPERRVFAPFRLLEGLTSDEETQARTPWWLVALRLTLAAFVIIALARPVLFPAVAPTGDGPLVLVIDDGWAATADWRRTQRNADARIDAAGRDGRDVVVVFTAPRRLGATPIERLSPREARRLVAGHTPTPWPTDRADTAARLDAAHAAGDAPDTAAVEWLSDGLADGGAVELARVLTSLGRGRVTTPAAARTPLALMPPTADGGGFAAHLQRAEPGPERTGTVIVLDRQGRGLARAPFVFEDGSTTATARITLPVELRNQARLIAIDGAVSAGAAHILDDRWTRTTVGLAAATANDDRQPLLADLHYVETALEPFADARRAPLGALLDDPPSAIVLVDAGRIVGADHDRLALFVENGGLLIRFAGPRLAARADDLSPVELRAGDRALGGALAWDEPQPLMEFEPDSPFHGLAVSEEATVSRQVLAEPTPDLSEHTWARLADGTPLVTSARRGQGRIVLFHVTAAPEWSTLPLTGLFTEMLKRTLAFADARPTVNEAASGDWRLETALDEKGRLSAPSSNLAPVDPVDFETAHATAATPPGLWARAGENRAINVMTQEATLAPLPNLPAALERVTDTGPASHPLGGLLLALALVLLAADAIAVAALAGLLARPRFGAPKSGRSVAAAVAGLALLTTLAAPDVTHAQDGAFAADSSPSASNLLDEDFVLAALDVLHLAYVRTGDPDIDAMSEAGIRGLSFVLNQRTSIEPGAPLGIDIETDPFEFLPLLYWPVTPDAQAPSPEVANRIDAYLKNGGVIIFDTQDAGSSAIFGNAPHPGLARLVDAIDVPPLAPIPHDHVMTKAFYLLSDFPGRWRDAPLWVVSDASASSRDGVSSVMVTSADWAAAWAVDRENRALASVTPGGERQREMARRTGVNLVMYVLTGNYKADQVHIPAILDRLGQ